MNCCISNRIPREPVVSVKCGCLFERSLVEKYIDEHGTCPTTGEPLTRADLITVRPSVSNALTGALAVQPEGANSVAGLLDRLRAEWDATMLEQFTLRQRQVQMEQELSHALQRYEAACRVVASLTRERDALQQRRQRAEDEAPAALPSEVIKAIEAQDTSVLEERKRRKTEGTGAAVATGVTADSYAEKESLAVGSAALCVCAANGATHVGSADGKVRRYSNSELVATGAGHSQAVTAVAAVAEGVVVSASADGTVRVWRSSAEELVCAHVLRYPAQAGALSRGAIGGRYCLVGGREESIVYLSDIEAGEVLYATAPIAAAGETLTALELHPRGTLAALATGAHLRLWDVRQMSTDTVVTLPTSFLGKAGRVHNVAFSADCVTFAAGSDAGAVMIWDARRIAEPLATVQLTGEHPASLCFAPAGAPLLAAGCGDRVSFITPTDGKVTHHFESEKATFTGIAWAQQPQGSLLASSAEGVVRVYTA